MQQVIRGIIRLSKGLDWVAGFFLVMAMVLAVGNVIMRGFGKPIQGIYEWLGFLIAIAGSWALASCYLQNGHISLSIVVDRLPFKAAKVIDVIINFISLIFLLFIAWHTILYGYSFKISGHASMTTQTPIYPFVYALAFGILIMCLALVAKQTEDFIKETDK